jgi:hypothetical protein
MASNWDAIEAGVIVGRAGATRTQNDRFRL